MNVLVVGTPRSGTTLLTCLIGAHPDCIAMSECFWGEEHKIVSPSEVIANKLCTPNQIQFRHPSVPTLLQRAVTGVQQKLGERTGLWGKEWPLGALSIRDYVRDRDAHLLLILRNPDQVIDSMICRSGLSEQRALSRWAHGIREMYEAYSAYGPRCHTVNFSQLVAEPESTLREICGFMGLDYLPAMRDGYKYVPQYHRSTIDESISDRDVQEYRVEERCTRSYEKYRCIRRA